MTRETLAPTAWLGAKLSVLAAALAVVLPLIGDVSRWPMVAAVAGVAFTASWIQTGRIQRGESGVLTLSRASASTI